VKRWLTAAVVAGVAAAAVAAVGWWRGSTRRVAVEGPIVLVSIDTLRADRLPVYGYTRGSTPRLDAFAREAVVFDRAYAHAPLTLPSHASILTGRLPFEHGVRDNIGFTLADGTRMVQHELGDRGFTTAGFVSAYVMRRETGIASGFDEFDDTMPAAGAGRPLGQVQRDGSDTMRAAERWLAARRSDRFFLFFHIYEPHRPYAPPRRYRHLAPYDGDVAYADEIVGTLLDSLRAKGLYDEATIIVVSDHGEGLGDHVEQEHGLFIYDESVRVPLIVKLPGGTSGGRRVSQPVQHVDLAPTILELAGGTPGPLKGRSLVPLLNGAGTVPSQGVYAEALYSRYHFGWSELLALTDERYRYIKAPREELYDLARDPDERTNIAAERPQVAAALRQALDRMSAGADFHEPSEVSAEDRQRLAALGYIGAGPTAAARAPAGQLPDPKDKVRLLERYRQATDLLGRMEVAPALRLFDALVREDPAMTDVWAQYAQALVFAGDIEGALSAYREILQRNPADTGTLLAAASALLQLGRLTDARRHAELTIEKAPASAHEMLARIAVRAGDADAARRHAAAAGQADPTLPMPDVVEGLLRYHQQRYAESLPYFLRAAQRSAGRTIQIDDLHYYTGDALARLERYAEAEQYFRTQIALNPRHTRARASLAMLYRAMGRDEASDRAVDEMLRVTPTAEAFTLAADLWTMFGRPERAAATRAQARARFPPAGAPAQPIR